MVAGSGAAVNAVDDESVGIAEAGDEDDAPAPASAAASSASGSGRGSGKRWSHADTLVLLDGVLEYTKEHGKPSKKSGKSDKVPGAWAYIATQIAQSLSKARDAESAHNRFFNVPGLLMV